MALLTVNDYILLEEVTDKSSQFGSKGDNKHKFKVAYGPGTLFEPGAIVYVLNTLGKINIDDQEYEVAQKDEVVAYVA